MTKFSAYVTSAILFVLLVILFIFEIREPTAGYALVHGLLP